ncbi:MAG TPA: adenosine deaminase [Streptosporangiaceae bacterium]|nr:adenosine deaminase [Streptosporangiaceae bacterium]
MTLPPEVRDFILAVPKVELHVHLVGSASAATVARLAEQNGSTTVPTDEDALREFLRFTSFAHFIEVYTAVSSLVTSGADLADLVEGAAADLASQNVRYVEMTVTPYPHVSRGMPYGELAEALGEGRRRAAALGVEFAWVYDIAGDDGPAGADATTRFATRQPPEGLVGFGLGGTEAGVDRASYADAFDQARASGLASVPHAGEADGPASVWAALRSLRAERIGHGVRSVEDPALVAYLAEHGIPLEVCPSSNVCTRVYPSLADHPVKALMDAGVTVTLNSDDPPMFSTTLTQEYERVAGTFGLGVAEVAALLRNAVNASLLSPDRKKSLLSDIDEAAAAAAG